ncbi:thermonuclease family protein [Taklimakanibacter lacteus]|uniref:thermonuclease family protein n=1 Tax=Taklimakanibacter lacteus TaxID=2268456 RepID=UPI000E66AF60
MGSPAPVAYRRYRRSWRRGPPRPPRPLWRSLLDIVMFIVAACLVLLAIRAFNQITVTPGTADIIDGDSFRLGKDEIRLNGIDAPEYRQTCRDANGRDWNCGREAARALRNLVAGKTVDCTGLDADRYGRLVSRCRVGDLTLNAEMVRLGWAIAYTRHSAAYVKEEAEARRDKRGIWRGTFDLPEDWRAAHRADMSDGPHD